MTTHYVFDYSPSTNGEPSQFVGAAKLDGNTIVLAGEDEWVEYWFEYFSDPDTMFDLYRDEESPLGMVFGGTYSDADVVIEQPGQLDGEQKWVDALSKLGGKKIKTVELVGE